MNTVCAVALFTSIVVFQRAFKSQGVALRNTRRSLTTIEGINFTQGIYNRQVPERTPLPHQVASRRSLVNKQYNYGTLLLLSLKHITFRFMGRSAPRSKQKFTREPTTGG